MSGVNDAAAAETPLERVQRFIRAVEDELDEIRKKKTGLLSAGCSKDELDEIDTAIDKKEEYHGKLLDEKRSLEAKMSGVPIAPGACPISPCLRPIPLRLPHP